MTIPTPLATRVQGMLLALAVFVLTGFTASGAGEPVVRRSLPPVPVAAEGYRKRTTALSRRGGSEYLRGSMGRGGQFSGRGIDFGARRGVVLRQ